MTGVIREIYPGIKDGLLMMKENTPYKGFIIGIGSTTGPNGMHRMYIDISTQEKEHIRIHSAAGIRQIFYIKPPCVGDFISIVLTKRGQPSPTGPSRHLFSVKFHDKDRNPLAFLVNQDDGHVTGELYVLGLPYKIDTKVSDKPIEPTPEKSVTTKGEVEAMFENRTSEDSKITNEIALRIRPGDKLTTYPPRFHEQTGLYRVIVDIGQRRYHAGLNTVEEAETFRRHVHNIFLGTSVRRGLARTTRSV